MTNFNIASLRSCDATHDLMFMGQTPVCYHCHHFNLFLDQTVSDSLGHARSEEVRVAAAATSFRPLLEELVVAAGAHTGVEKLSLARQLFAAMGHGLLDVQDHGETGSAVGQYLHYGHSWREKYGRFVNCLHAMDSVAAGFAAAALEVARGATPGSLRGTEKRCTAMRHPDCHLEIVRGRGDTSTAVSRSAVMRGGLTPMAGLHEDHVVNVADGLRNFTAGVHGNEHGLVPAFGVFVTMHSTGYYNAITYETIRALEREAPGMVSVAEELFRESGHVCVFNTFGGILLSPEWEGMVGTLKNDVSEIVSGCVAIARALGFGHWVIHELEANKRLVLRATTTYEASYFLAKHGVSERSYEYFLQGAALAICRLAHRVDWESRPTLTQQFYGELFRGEMPWKVEQTKSLHRGDSFSEVVVTKHS